MEKIWYFFLIGKVWQKMDEAYSGICPCEGLKLFSLKGGAIEDGSIYFARGMRKFLVNMQPDLLVS